MVEPRKNYSNSEKFMRGVEKVTIVTNNLLLGVQGRRSGESTRLPPMWPGFDSHADPATNVG